MLNTGISTLAGRPALTRLASERVKHLWIHEGPRYPRVARQLAEQSHGSHADEMETSLMLALAPHLVDMTRAEASPELAGDAGRIDAVGPEFAELQPLRQLWRSDTGDIGQGEALLAAMLDDLHEQAAAFIAQGAEQRGDRVRRR